MLMLVGVADTAFGNILINGDLESYGDDGSGRIMPDGWGLATTSGNWDNIPLVQSTTAEARTGSASMKMDLTLSSTYVVFEQQLDHANVGDFLLSYRLSGWIKGTVGAGSYIGVDMFAPDRSDWWWGGGTEIPAGIYADWTEFTYDFSTVAPSAWNAKVVAGDNTSNFLVDDLVLFVPEPATFSLIAVAGGVLMLVRRRISRF